METDSIPPNPFQMWEDSLTQLSKTFITDKSLEKRENAINQFMPVLSEALNIKESFSYPFDSVQYISIQYPEDRSFRILTWQLYVNENRYQYYGLIQMADGQVFPLNDYSDEIEDVEYEVVPADEWYGVVYYNIKEFKPKSGDRQYLLFGFDGYQFFDKRKVVDVLSFRNGKPYFGGPVFAKIEEGRSPITKNRLLMEYSAESSTTLNYNAIQKQIICDHLQSVPSPYTGKLTNIPDGTYVGYEFHRKKGLWVFVEKLYHEVMDEAPRPSPVLGGENKKDLFGN